MLTIPHYGVIFRNVGRIEIDINAGAILVYAGHWDDIDGLDEDLVALCEVLVE